MSNHGLMCITISVTVWLGRIYDLSHLFLLRLCQINLSGSKVLLEPLCLGCSWDGYHALYSYPRKCNLSNRAPFTRSQCFDLFHNGTILVEVFTLKLGSWIMICQLTAVPSAALLAMGERGFVLHIRRKSSGAKSSGVLNGKSSTSQPWPRGLYAT